MLFGQEKLMYICKRIQQLRQMRNQSQKGFDWSCRNIIKNYIIIKGDVVPPFQTLMAILNMRKIWSDQQSLILIMIFFSQWIVNQLIRDIVTYGDNQKLFCLTKDLFLKTENIWPIYFYYYLVVGEVMMKSWPTNKTMYLLAFIMEFH